MIPNTWGLCSKCYVHSTNESVSFPFCCSFFPLSSSRSHFGAPFKFLKLPSTQPIFRGAKLQNSPISRYLSGVSNSCMHGHWKWAFQSHKCSRRPIQILINIVLSSSQNMLIYLNCVDIWLRHYIMSFIIQNLFHACTSCLLSPVRFWAL